MKHLKNKKISLVLGSGGARGLTHIGVIKEIENQGGEITEIVGTSIGALIGGIYAKGELQEFENWIKGLSNKDIFSLLDFTWANTGWIKGDRIIDTLKKIIDDCAIENLPIEFTAVATNLTRNTDHFFRTGSLYDAIRASIAIPGIFTSVNLEGQKLVDGAVLNPLPINHVKKSSENLIFAVNLDGPYINGPEIFKDDTSISVLQHSYYLMRDQITKLTLLNYRTDCVINIPKDISGIWDYNKATHLIEYGESIAREEILKYKNSNIDGI